MKYRFGKKSSKKTIAIGLIAAALVAAAVGAVLVLQKEEQPQVPEETAKVQEQETRIYLSVTEWEVMVPLSELTKTASYKISGNTAQIKINNKDEESCSVPALLNKVTPDMIDTKAKDGLQLSMSFLEESASKVGDNYYYITGNKNDCAKSESKSDLLKQTTKIEPLRIH